MTETGITTQGVSAEAPDKEKNPTAYLCWGLWKMRLKLYQDQHYQPYAKKHLGQAKQLVEKAGGDLGEIARRAVVLASFAAADEKQPPFWQLTLGDLLSKWERLVPKAVSVKPQGKREQQLAGLEHRLQELRREV
jgi:hypothetical protein